MNYLEAVEHKMRKQGKYDNEIKRELNKIQGIKEKIVIKSNKDAGPSTNQTSS